MSSVAGKEFVFRCTPSARDFLLEEGTDSKFGARHLKRSIERHLVFPLSNLLATRQIELDDLVTINYHHGVRKLTFAKENFSGLAGTAVGAASAAETLASVCDAGAVAAAAVAAASEQRAPESRRTIRKKQQRAGDVSGRLSSTLPSESVINN